MSDWPCEWRSVSGGERLRGKQVTTATTHVVIGDYHFVSSVTSAMRCVINSVIYGVVSVRDIEGDSREMFIELKREA